MKPSGDPLGWLLQNRAEVREALRSAARGPDEAELLPELLETVTRFAEKHLDARALDASGSIPRELREGLAELGLFGMTVPAGSGGLELSLPVVCRVIERLAFFDRSVAIMVGLHSGLGTRPLVDLGSEELKARYLPEFASGERIASFCATEPEAGSDLAHVAVELTPDGSDYLLRGEKSYVTNGAFAGAFTVLSHFRNASGKNTHCLVFVPAESPGISIGAEEDKLGIRASSTVTVHFDDVRVPAGQILGGFGAGLEQAQAALCWGRTIMSAGCIGTAERALQQTVEHVRSRRQFGTFIGDFGAVRAEVGNMAGELRAARHLVRLAALRRGGPWFSELSALAKVVSSETTYSIADRALQLHGALGFLEQTGVALLARDCRITRIFEGANDVLLLRHGGLVLSRPSCEPAVGFDLALPPEVRDDAERFVQLLRAFMAETRRIQKRFGVRATRHQLLLLSVARSHAALLTALACLIDAESSETDDARLLAHAGARHHLEVCSRELTRLGEAVSEEECAKRLAESMYRRSGDTNHEYDRGLVGPSEVAQTTRLEEHEAPRVTVQNPLLFPA